MTTKGTSCSVITKSDKQFYYSPVFKNEPVGVCQFRRECVLILRCCPVSALYSMLHLHLHCRHESAYSSSLNLGKKTTVRKILLLLLEKNLPQRYFGSLFMMYCLCFCRRNMWLRLTKTLLLINPSK